MTSGIEIIGTGSYVPEFIASNDKFAEFLDTNDEWITTRTGISERRIMTDKPNYYMATEAAKRAIENAKIDPKEIDLILLSTCSPDFFYPALSCLVQKAIGAENAACFDLNSACTGFISALDVAQKYLATDHYKTILIISSEKLSNQLDYTDRSMCILFGDAAGAAVVRKSDKPFFSMLGASGDEFQALYCKVNYDANCPFSKGDSEFYGGIFDTEQKQKYLQSDGHAVYKFAVNAMSKACLNVMEQGGYTVEDIDLVVPHQANLRIINKASEMLGIKDSGKVYTNIQHYGNVSSACIPVALDELNRSGKLKDCKRICFVGFGAGLTYGAIVMDM